MDASKSIYAENMTYQQAALVLGTSWQQVRDIASAGILEKVSVGVRGKRLRRVDVSRLAGRGLTTKERNVLSDYRARRQGVLRGSDAQFDIKSLGPAAAQPEHLLVSVVQGEGCRE